MSKKKGEKIIIFVNKYLFVSAAGELQFAIPAIVYKFAKNLDISEQF